jgi:hypothetical protein
MKSRTATTIVKIVLTFGLMLLLVQQIGAPELLQALRSIRPWFLLAVPVIVAMDTLLRTYSWHRLLRTRGFEVSMSRLLRVNMAGAFFGAFLPSSLGTDLARTSLLATEERIRAEESLSSVLMLNLLGLLALCLLALGGALLLGHRLEGPGLVRVIGLVSFGGITAVAALLSGSAPGLRRLPIPSALRRVARLDEIGAALAAYLRDRVTLARVLGLALISQLMGVLLVFSLSLSTRSDVPLPLLLVLVPAINLLRLIPLSIAGFGAEQGIFVSVFVLAGQRAAEAFLISLLSSSVVLLFALAGGVVYGLRTLWRRNEFHHDAVPYEKAVASGHDLG